MKENRLPLFESLAAVFAVSLVSLLTALPASPEKTTNSSVELHASLTELRTATFRTALANNKNAQSLQELETQLSRYIDTIPKNPVNSLKTIRSMGAEYSRPILNGSAGWVYVPATGRIFPDLPGTDEKGTPYSVW